MSLSDYNIHFDNADKMQSYFLRSERAHVGTGFINTGWEYGHSIYFTYLSKTEIVKIEEAFPILWFVDLNVKEGWVLQETLGMDAENNVKNIFENFATKELVELRLESLDLDVTVKSLNAGLESIKDTVTSDLAKGCDMRRDHFGDIFRNLGEVDGIAIENMAAFKFPFSGKPIEIIGRVQRTGPLKLKDAKYILETETEFVFIETVY